MKTPEGYTLDGGSSDPRPFRNFQIRWDERMWCKDKPYLRRWTFIFFGYSIRIHRWYRSDDKRYFHDHPWKFITIMLWGSYKNVTPKGEKTYSAGHVAWADGEAQHYIDVPKGWGALTILITGRPYKKWGYYVNGHMWRPLRYYHKFGHPGIEIQ